MESEGCNDGTTPQEQDNGCNDGTTPQEQQTEAQQPEGNGCNNGTTPQEQQMEAQQPEGNAGQMYLFLDDESDYIEDESEEDTVQTEQRTANEISSPSDRRLKLQRLLLGERSTLALPSVVLLGKTTCRLIKFDVISYHCQN